MSSGCDTGGYCILRAERTLTVFSDFYTDVIVVAGAIKGKGRLAEASSLQNRVLQKNHVVFHTLLSVTVLDV